MHAATRGSVGSADGARGASDRGGAPIHGTNGLYFDRHDRLYIASVSGREIVVMDPDSGKILDRIGPERGVESPDDLTFGPDGSLYWTALLTGEVGKLTPDGKKVIVAQGLMGANPITFSEDGRLFVARDFMGDGLYELDPNGVKPPRAIDENAGRSEWLRLRAGRQAVRAALFRWQAGVH